MLGYSNNNETTYKTCRGILCEYYGGPSLYGLPHIFPVRYALSKKKKRMCNFRQVTKVLLDERKMKEVAKRRVSIKACGSL